MSKPARGFGWVQIGQKTLSNGRSLVALGGGLSQVLSAKRIDKPIRTAKISAVCDISRHCLGSTAVICLECYLSSRAESRARTGLEHEHIKRRCQPLSNHTQEKKTIGCYTHLLSADRKVCGLDSTRCLTAVDPTSCPHHGHSIPVGKEKTCASRVGVSQRTSANALFQPLFT